MTTIQSNRISGMEDWKAGVILVILLVSVFPILIGSHIVAHHYLSVPWIPADSEGALIGIPVALCLYVLVPRLLDYPIGDAFIDTPRVSSLRWFGWGLVITSTLTLGAIVVLPSELTTGNLALHAVLRAVIGAVLLALLAAITEELVFRGYMLSILGHRLGWKESIVVTSAIFGLLHNAKVDEAIGTELYMVITMIAGLLYALVTYYTGSVWPAVMLHTAWNTSFHPDVLEISAANGADSAILTVHYTSSNLLFGGNFADVIGSPFVALLLLACTIIVVTYYELHGASEYSLT